MNATTNRVISGFNTLMELMRENRKLSANQALVEMQKAGYVRDEAQRSIQLSLEREALSINREMQLTLP